ncbi:90 kDa surface protein, putative [Trypanosoma cruzi]|uniref:90 kDa surface protein, putative n=1 Tax=Trypanosoma cruzi (strain CL Brener) TaxID=353153 RepID=Q4E213_TRYCC|nr:90 kDa surface protein, putative [Trypanosoma cruzi]EAN98803.1 90 kDa surface protein, putative [Trypanosoma cruzi]|eukprot:XP_820654.1 90 kDa surface protein [Trypanosoma cruzi strain CL Brener]
MMRRLFCVVLAFALLCCCSCVFAVEEEEQEPQVTQVNAECAGKDKLGRWQLPGRSLWYNCTDSSTGAGKMICGMGVGNCAPEDVQRRIKDGAKDGVFTINVSTFTPSAVKSWWERNVEPKAVTAAIVPAKPPEAGPPGPQEDKDSRGTSTPVSDSPPAGAAGAAGAPSLAEAPGDSGEIGPAKPLEAEPPSPQEDKISREKSSRPDSESSPAVVENSADVPPSSPPATPGGAGANPVAGAAATTDPSAAALGASDSALSGELQGPSHSTSPASSPAPESIPDPEPTEGGDHSSHEPPVELQEETAAAPPTQLSQTGEDGSAAGGAEEDTAANTTTDTASGKVNSTAASMPAPLSSAPTTNALENIVGTDACFHDTHLHALPLLVLAALTYGTLG